MAKILGLVIDDVWSKEDMRELTKDYMDDRINQIKTGKVIKKKYKLSTVQRRKRHGLQTGHIDLTRK